MTPQRRGPIIAGIWLIGVGVVVLLQRLSGWTWSEAWPMFIILAGVAGTISAVIARSSWRSTVWTLVWPLAVTGIGVALLASTTGSLGIGPAELIASAWPWVAVGLGLLLLVTAVVSAEAPIETLAVPLAGAQRAQVGISFGAGELVTHRAAPGDLVDGTFPGGVRHRLDGPGRVDLESDFGGGLPWLDHSARWDVGLTGEVPLDLRLETGANRGSVDLSDLQVASLVLETGASDTRIRLPRAAGATTVNVQAGAAAVTIEVPDGVAARIHSQMALGSSHIDEARFPRLGDLHQSPDYPTAANRVDIDVQGGLGSLQVVGTG
jgi:hypothetical protein